MERQHTKIASESGRSGHAASSLFHCESGQALIVAAICMVVLVGFLGLAIDVGQCRLQKRHLQMAADAAALAGALELTYCGGSSNCSVVRQAAQQSLVENGLSEGSILTNCSPGTGVGLEVTINNPPCAFPSDPNAGHSSYVEVILSRPQATIFASVLGIRSVPIKARAEAGRTSPGNCIYALDPSGSGALSVDLFASLTANCGVMVESASSSALSCPSFSAIKATRISVVGGVQSFRCKISPLPTTRSKVPTPFDPLAYLPAPTVPACGTSTQSPYTGSSRHLSLSGTATLYPGSAYCGGITIMPGANVTFEPGIYVLTSKWNSGGLNVDVGSTVSGSGVTFYNYGPTGGITFSFTSFWSRGVSLVAPTSGTYSGILFMQAPQNTTRATIIGSPSWNTVLEGSYYFPKAKVVFAFDGRVNYNILVAYDIEFAFMKFANNVSATSGFYSNYTPLKSGCPLSSAGAVVVQ